MQRQLQQSRESYMNHLPARSATSDVGTKVFIEGLRRNSLNMITAFVDPSLATAKAVDKFQFERRGYLVADRADHLLAKPVFNLAVRLKDSWGK